MSCKERLVGLFDAHGIPFRLHTPGSSAGEAAAEPAPPAVQIAVAFRSGRPVMLVVGAGRNLDSRMFSRVLGREDARLALEPEVERIFPDCEVGAMPAIGHLYGIPVYIDTDLAREPEITFPTGSYDESVTISMRAFERLTWPTHAALVTPVGRAA